MINQTPTQGNFNQGNNQQYIPQVTPVYNPVQTPTIYGTQTRNSINNKTFYVQGVSGAKGFFMNEANAEVYLRDSENPNILYIKTTDANCAPSLVAYRLSRIDISELEPVQSMPTGQYVTMDEFNKLSSKIDRLLEKQNNYHKSNKRKPRYEEDNDYDE